jgi:hypothetical protein
MRDSAFQATLELCSFNLQLLLPTYLSIYIESNSLHLHSLTYVIARDQTRRLHAVR